MVQRATQEADRHAGIDPPASPLSHSATSPEEFPIPTVELSRQQTSVMQTKAAPKLSPTPRRPARERERQRPRSPSTRLTHLGSTTGGRARNDYGPGTADRLILAGSPGGGVQFIDEYSVPKEHIACFSRPRGRSARRLRAPLSSWSTLKTEGIHPPERRCHRLRRVHTLSGTEYSQPHVLLPRRDAHVSDFRQHRSRRQPTTDDGQI